VENKPPNIQEQNTQNPIAVAAITSHYQEQQFKHHQDAAI
jgi:hypothetical protein